MKVKSKKIWADVADMLRPYLKIWEWEWIFGRAVKAISSPGIRRPCLLGQANKDLWSFPAKSQGKPELQ